MLSSASVIKYKSCASAVKCERSQVQVQSVASTVQSSAMQCSQMQVPLKASAVHSGTSANAIKCKCSQVKCKYSAVKCKCCQERGKCCQVQVQVMRECSQVCVHSINCKLNASVVKCKCYQVQVLPSSSASAVQSSAR